MSIRAAEGRRFAFELRTVATSPYSVTADYARDYLLRFTAATSERVLVFPYRLLWSVLRGGVRREVHLDVRIIEDIDNRSRSHEALAFTWHVRSRFFPVIDGVLHSRIAEGFETLLVLSCSYRIAPGIIHDLFDRCVGRRVARAVAGALLERLVTYSEARERAFRDALSPAPPG